MNTTSCRFAGLLSLGVALFATTALQAAEYKFIKDIAVGGAGGFDYLSVDSDAHRLYVTHGGKVVVIDTEKDAVVGEIADTPGVHGFALALDLKRGFASNGRENKVSIVELDTLKTLSKVDTGQNPDAILYEPAQSEVYVFNGRSSDATVFEAKTGKVIATIPLGGKPETGVADSKANRVYVNIETKNEIAVIDTQTHKVVANWPVAPAGKTTGLAFDLAHHRLFTVGNKFMAMLDSTSGKVVASVPIGADTDAAAFDPGTQLAFASNGDGTMTIVHEDSPEKLTAVQTLTTRPGARTMTIDLKTHKLYQAAGANDAFKVIVSGM